MNGTLKAHADLMQEIWGFWGEVPGFRDATWRREVEEGKTRLSYFMWVATRRDEIEDEARRAREEAKPAKPGVSY